MKWFSIHALASAILISSACAATLTRGPYLQNGTPTSVAVRWRTDVATDTKVFYGSAPGNLTGLVFNASATTEHEITLSDLTPGTTNFYSIGSSSATLAGNDANHYFVTFPPIGAAAKARIWVLGDAGTANANQVAVRDAFFTFNGSRHTDLWLMLGDNAYNVGSDSEYQSAVFNMYPTMLRKSVLFSALGNHETAQATSYVNTYPYFSIFTLPTVGEGGGVPSGTEHFYSFDFGNIHFVCLDSMTADRATNGVMANWLRADLANTIATWIVAFWHHPPYTKGSHNSDTETELIQMRENFNPILEAGGVDLVLSGHSHSYERSFLINGHYGLSTTFDDPNKIDGGNGRDATPYAKGSGLAAHAGAVYSVAGSSGQISGGTLNHPAMFVSLNVLGSVVLDFATNRLDFQFINSSGSVQDYFTLTKGAAPTRPANLAATAGNAQITLRWNASALAAGYNVKRAATTDGPYTIIASNISATNYSDTAVINGMTNYYVVSAVNADGEGANSAEVSVAARSSVVARHLFYNNSSWDGINATANANDDAAIAIDKAALLPGATAKFTNYTSYSRGLNGVMIDIAGLPWTPTSSDFLFRKGNDGTPGAWTVAATPTITVRTGAGAGGSDRVTLLWADNVIQKQWLQVTVLATTNTGLAFADVFYFGNAIGESGSIPANAQVDLADEIDARNHPRNFVNPALINDPYDFDRNQRVDLLDEIIARNNPANFVTAVQLITSPATGASVGATGHTNSFGAQPLVGQWSTASLSGSAGDLTTAAGLDTAVQWSSASAIATQVSSSAANPPANLATATWSASGFYLQTRPTSVGFTLLMCTLVNNLGTNISAVTISYDFNKTATAAENVEGHRAYYSLSGAPWTWTVIPEFCSAASGRLTATFNVAWPGSSPLYILWADDNGAPSPDTANQIDNFSAKVAEMGAAPPISHKSTRDIPLMSIRRDETECVITLTGTRTGSPQLEFTENPAVGPWIESSLTPLFDATTDSWQWHVAPATSAAQQFYRVIIRTSQAEASELSQ